MSRNESAVTIRGMRHDRLPDGFGVRIDPRVRAFSGGRILIGGTPARMLRLAPEAAELIGDGYLEVTDRKSTRLNSSHAKISYAVVCLKKKNNTPAGDAA